MKRSITLDSHYDYAVCYTSVQ